MPLVVGTREVILESENWPISQLPAASQERVMYETPDQVFLTPQSACHDHPETGDVQGIAK